MTEQNQQQPNSTTGIVSRRSTLRAIGGLLAAGAAAPLLAACGQSATTGSASTSAAVATTSAPAATSTAATTASSSVVTTAAASTTASTGSGTSAATTSAATSAAPTSATAAAPAVQPGTLNLFVNKINTPPGAQDALLKTLIASFQQTNTGVKVAYNTYSSAAEESTKIETSVASNSGPDIFEFGSTVVPTAAATGAFVVITDALWNTIGGSEGKAKFFPAQLKMSGLTPNALIAVPEYMLPFALVYNTDLLTASGDQPPTTWTEFVNTAKKMTDPAQDQWGTVMDPSDSFDPWHILWVLAKQLGGDFISADMTQSTMTSDPVYKAFRFWFDWMANYKIAKTSDATFKGPDLLNKFASGKVGFMVMQGPTTIPTLDKSAVKGKYAFSPMPTVPYGLTSLPSGGVPVQTFVSGQYLTIAKFSKLQDDAILWMKYVTDVTQQMQFLKTYGYMPGIVDAYKQPELQTPVWKAFVAAENNAYATPLTGAWGPIETIVGGVASKIAAEYATNSYKTGDLKNALAATNSSIQTALSAQKK